MAELFHTLTVSSIKRLTDDAVQVAFVIPDDLADVFAFTPGQYLTLRAKINGQDIRRPYSICSAPMDSTLCVGIREVQDGRFSSYANQVLKAGDTLSVMPPQGRFGVINGTVTNSRRLLTIAAGSGITPILSIIRSRLEQTPADFVTLVYGNKQLESIMFRHALDDLKDRYLDQFRLIHCTSRETQDIELFNGRIDAAKVTALSTKGLIDPQLCDQVLICGPTAMSDDIGPALTTLGVQPEQIAIERFTPADDVDVNRPPSGAVVEVTEQGVDVTVIMDGSQRQFTHTDPYKSLLEAARDAGIELPFSCAGGMCATCRCKLIAGDGEMAVNYSLEPWELEAGFVLACQTRPTSDAIIVDFDAV